MSLMYVLFITTPFSPPSVSGVRGSSPGTSTAIGHYGVGRTDRSPYHLRVTRPVVGTVVGLRRTDLVHTQTNLTLCPRKYRVYSSGRVGVPYPFSVPSLTPSDPQSVREGEV